MHCADLRLSCFLVARAPHSGSRRFQDRPSCCYQCYIYVPSLCVECALVCGPRGGADARRRRSACGTCGTFTSDPYLSAHAAPWHTNQVHLLHHVQDAEHVASSQGAAASSPHDIEQERLQSEARAHRREARQRCAQSNPAWVIISVCSAHTALVVPRREGFCSALAPAPGSCCRHCSQADLQCEYRSQHMRSHAPMARAVCFSQCDHCESAETAGRLRLRAGSS